MDVFSENEVKTSAKNVALALAQDSPFSYLIKNFPIRIDEKVSQYHMGIMKQNNLSAMCTGDYIAINTEALCKDVNEAYNSTQPPQGFVADEIKTVICHEYNHLLLDHQKDLAEYLETKPQPMEETAFRLAQDTIANRGMGVETGTNLYRSTMVTDNTLAENGITDTAKLYTVAEVQQKILEFFAKQSGGDGSQNQQSKKPDNENGDKQQNGNENDHQNSNSSGTQNESPSSKGSDSGNSDGSNQAKASNLKMSEELKKAVEQTEKDMAEKPNLAPTKTAAQIMGLDEDENEGDEDGQPVGGSDLDNGDDNEVDGSEKGQHGSQGGKQYMNRDQHAVELLQKYNDRYKQKQIAKNLSRLRGVIQGDLAKTKTKTYSRPPRRTYEGDLMKKGTKKDRRANPAILVALDSSGSMSETAVTQVASAIDSIVKQLGRNINNCYICLHDGRTGYVNKLKDWRKTTEHYYPSGGNNFSNVYELAKEKHCQVVLNVGDGLDRVMTERGENKQSEKTKNGNIIWYDVIVSDLGRYSKFYWEDVIEDEVFGLNRKQLDLTGKSLWTRESLDPKYVEEIRRSAEHRKNSR